MAKYLDGSFTSLDHQVLGRNFERRKIHDLATSLYHKYQDLKPVCVEVRSQTLFRRSKGYRGKKFVSVGCDIDIGNMHINIGNMMF